MAENFDLMAAGWDDEPRRIERAAVIAQEIIAAIPDLRGMTGFEYGCGTGLLSFNLHTHLSKVILGDSSEGMLDVVRQKISLGNVQNMEALNIDLAQDSLPIGSFNIIYTLMTLHHIVDLDKVINEFYRALSSNGYLCIADLNEEDGSFHGDGFVGHNGFDMKVLAGQLEKVGFRNIQYKLCYEVKKISRDGNMCVYPVFLMIAEK